MAYCDPIATGIQNTKHVFGGDSLVLREVFEEYPGPFALFDNEDRLIEYNTDYEALHEKALSDCLSDGQSEIFFSDILRAAFRDTIPKDNQEAFLRSHVARHRRADGTPYDHLYPGHGWIRYRKVRTPSGMTSVFGIDVTELKTTSFELEKAMLAARAANEAKSNFLANMSHELRTPLNAIIGFSEALLIQEIGGLKEGVQTEYVNDIRSAGGHLLSVISQVLDLAKIEAGAMEIHLQTCCLYDIVEECVAMLEVNAIQKEVALNIHNDAENTIVLADRQRLKQATLNIMTNAVKFSNDGGIVDILLEGTEDRMRIRVKDCGIGIPEDLLDVVFTPFGQVETAYTSMQEGTGLGLPIARTMIEAHNGQLILESEVGVGTTVTIDLSRL